MWHITLVEPNGVAFMEAPPEAMKERRLLHQIKMCKSRTVHEDNLKHTMRSKGKDGVWFTYGRKEYQWQNNHTSESKVWLVLSLSWNHLPCYHCGYGDFELEAQARRRPPTEGTQAHDSAKRHRVKHTWPQLCSSAVNLLNSHGFYLHFLGRAWGARMGLYSSNGWLI